MTINNRRLVLFGLPFLLLLIPALGMLFTSEVKWSLLDFAIAALLLYGTVFTIDFILRKLKSKTHKTLLVAAVIFLISIIWIELAVGLFGSPLAGS